MAVLDRAPRAGLAVQMASTLTDPDYRAFVFHLVARRHELGVSQSQLAARLGKHPSYVSKTERFERRLDPSEFRDFAQALGLSPVDEFAAVCAALSAAGRPGKAS